MASIDWLKMAKPKAGAMKVHLGRDERVECNHANLDIDKNRSSQNYYIGCNDYGEAYNAMCKRVEEIDKQYPPKRITKDRNICCMLEAKCPQEIFDSGRSREFFEKLYEVYEKFFGMENVHGSCVHLDEMHKYVEDGVEKMSLAHSHTLVSCYAEWQDKTGERRGINGKNFETKARLNALNKAVCDMVRREFGIEYNTGEKARHRTVEQLKAESVIENLNDIIGVTKQHLDKLVKEKNRLDKQLIEKRETIHQFDEKIDQRTLELTSIPPRPQLPPPLPPDAPRPMREHRAYSRDEEKALEKMQKLWDKSHTKGGERWKAEQAHAALTAQKKSEQAEWDTRYTPFDALKRQRAMVASKERELAAREEQMQAEHQQMQAELERGCAEVEKGKRSIQKREKELEKRERELDIESDRKAQEKLARTDNFQRLMATSAEFDKRMSELYKDADRRNAQAFNEKVKEIQKGEEE